MSRVKVKFAKVKPSAIIPSKSEENAGYDLYSCFEEDELTIEPLETKIIDSGIAMAVSSDYYFQIQERGSTGTKGMKYGAGVIDSSYRGSVMIPITNTSNKPLIITKDIKKTKERMRDYLSDTISKERKDEMINDCYTIYPYDKAIAQMVLLPVPKTEIEEITYEKLLEIPSERGTGKLGSSGK